MLPRLNLNDWQSETPDGNPLDLFPIPFPVWELTRENCLGRGGTF